MGTYDTGTDNKLKKPTRSISMKGGTWMHIKVNKAFHLDVIKVACVFINKEGE
jgi:hypothetical protein